MTHKEEYQNEEEYLLSEGLIVNTSEEVSADPKSAVSITDLKEEEFANNVKLVPDINEHSLTCNSADWTIYKKANKTKIIFLPMTGPTYN